MPTGKAIKSARQYGLMAAIAHGADYGFGPSPEVAEKLVRETSPVRRSAFMRTISRRRKKRRPRIIGG